MAGYALVAVVGIKDKHNVGGVIRAAQVYGAAGVLFQGERYKHQGSDAMKGYRRIPVFRPRTVEDLFEHLIPYDCVPVAVELVPQAVSLCTYRHPKRAVYILGGEDQTLGAQIQRHCRDVVYIPTLGCMNVAACANVVLYDRLTKEL